MIHHSCGRKLEQEHAYKNMLHGDVYRTLSPCVLRCPGFHYKKGVVTLVQYHGLEGCLVVYCYVLCGWNEPLTALDCMVLIWMFL